MKMCNVSMITLLCAMTFPVMSGAQDTFFTYQGMLTDGDVPANDVYDLSFTLYDAIAYGNQTTPPLQVDDVAVSNGLFTVVLDFGAQPFDGAARWIEVGVRPGAGNDTYTVLEPRQLVTASPYAIHARRVCASGIDGTIQSSNIGVLTSANLGQGCIGTPQLATNSIGSSQIMPNAIAVESLATNIGVWEKSGSSVRYNRGYVGIGISEPTAALDVNGTVKAASFAGDGSGLTNLPSGGTGLLVNPMQAALLKWYVGNKSFPAGVGACDLAFDGACLWIANRGENTVTRLRASDGANLGTYPVGRYPLSVTFDGEHVWVALNSDNAITKLRVRDGAVMGTYPVGRCPRMSAFDGENIWVGSSSENCVTKLRASDGANLGSFPVGASPHGIAFDGANIWVANLQESTVTKLRARDGAHLGTFPTGLQPFGVAFDGANVWVASGGEGVVSKLRATDGVQLGAYAVGGSAYDVAFDGANIWVSSHAAGTVTKIRAGDGSPANGTMDNSTYRNYRTPYGIAFDGANVWVVNGADNTVSKL